MSTMPTSEETPRKTLAPGDKVRITQVIVTRDGRWETSVDGEVVSVGAEPTGSWYAHGKDNRYWLRRIRLKKADGELTTVTVDGNSRIELLA
jgi:hypothetical protein